MPSTSQIQVNIANRVTLSGRELGSAFIAELQQMHTHENPEWIAAKARSKWGPPKRIPRYLQTWKTAGDTGYSFPRGSWAAIERMLRETGRPYVVAQTKCLGDARLREKLTKSPLRMRIECRPYQGDQVKAGAGNPTCLWRAPPGSGKTTSAFAYAAFLNLPTIVVVPSQSIFDQWVERCTTELGLAPESVGMIQGSMRRIGPVTIAMAQTLANCVDEYTETFGVFIADEVQRHGAKTFSAVSDRIHAYYRLGVSADERRADGKEFLIYELFGPVRHQVDREILVEQGFIHDAEIRVIATNTSADWYLRMKPTKRMKGEVQARLQETLAADDERTELVLSLLGWSAAAGEQALVLTWRREHARVIQSRAIALGHSVGMLLGGEDQKDERDRTLARLKAQELAFATGTYQAIGVGLDLPSIGRGIFAGPCANNTKTGEMQIRQYVGRFERPSKSTGKEGAIVYYLWDRHIFGDRPLKNLKKWFPGRTIVLDEDEWVPVGTYLKRTGATVSRATENEIEDFFG